MNYNYSRRLNRPVLYFKYFTILDLFGIVAGVIVVPLIVGMGAFIFGLVLWFAYTISFRIGRPPGYGVHFFKSFTQTAYFSVGRVGRRRVVNRT